MSFEKVSLDVTPVAPVRVEPRGGVWFVDFGKAAYGNLQITFAADVPGGEMTVRLGEKLSADGSIDRKPPGSVLYKEVTLRTEAGRRVYRLAIPPVERHVTHPSAVHMPPQIGEVTVFRYVEIDDPDARLAGASFEQLFVHAPFNDGAGHFECSDDTLNAVWKLCHYTMKATTAFGVYIDGERERIAYEGDAYINMLSHYACDLDPRVARHSFEHLLKFPTWPLEWSLHMPMIAADDYEATGEPVLAEAFWEQLKAKLLTDKANADGLLVSGAIVDWPHGERDGYNEGKGSVGHKNQVGPEINTVANAFYYHALRRMAMLAEATKRESDAEAFDRMAKQTAESFQQAFFDPAREIYIDGVGSSHASLHANMFALAFGLVPDEHVESVADFVESRGMACSVYGAQYLLDGLFGAGRDQYAVALMAARTERSWWHMIELGSTMTLEAWDAKAKPNLTWNHAWGAAPANILSRYVLGVRPLVPGYETILIAPQIGSLEWVRGHVPTPHGPVKVEVTAGETFRVTVEIPAGKTARVVVPCLADAVVHLDGQVVPFDRDGSKAVLGVVGSGRHVVECRSR